MADYIWLALLVVFLVVEALCPIHLVSLWFAAGSLAALAVHLLGAPLWLEVTVFFLVSCALLAALWPLVRKFLNPSHKATNLDAIIGSKGYVTQDIDNMAATGTVKLGAMEWTARSTADSNIPKGTLVQVDRIEGVKVFVTAAEVSASVTN